jgi:hypothetical protein
VDAAQQILAAWLREHIAPALREAGYKGSGQTFHRRLDRNWGVVNVQWSQWDWSERATFAINLGSASAVVLESRGMDPNRPPQEVECQWRTRLGELVASRDLWWEIRGDADDDGLTALADEVRHALLAVGLPAIEDHATDAVMLDAKLRQPGSTYVELDEIGILLNAVGGTVDQQQAFTTRVEKAREWMVGHEDATRPAQGPKRTDSNLARLTEPRSDRRAEAAYLLGGAKPTTPVLEALRERLVDPDPMVRTNAARSLADLGDRASLDRLIEMLGDEPDRFRAVELGSSLGRLAERDSEARGKILPVLHLRLRRAIGFDLVGFEVILDRLRT